MSNERSGSSDHYVHVPGEPPGLDSPERTVSEKASSQAKSSLGGVGAVPLGDGKEPTSPLLATKVVDLELTQNVNSEPDKSTEQLGKSMPGVDTESPPPGSKPKDKGSDFYEIYGKRYDDFGKNSQEKVKFLKFEIISNFL